MLLRPAFLLAIVSPFVPTPTHELCPDLGLLQVAFVTAKKKADKMSGPETVEKMSGPVKVKGKDVYVSSHPIPTPPSFPSLRSLSLPSP